VCLNQLDGDGDLDILSYEGLLLENSLSSLDRQRHLVVVPVDSAGAPALGAIVKVFNSSTTSLIGTRIVEPAQGNLQPPSELHFGLPSHDLVDISVTFHTPSPCNVKFLGCAPLALGVPGGQNRLLVVHPGRQGAFVKSCPSPSGTTGGSGSATPGTATSTGTSTGIASGTTPAGTTTRGVITTANTGPVRQPVARSSAGEESDSGILWIVVGIAAVVLLLAGVVVFLALRRRATNTGDDSAEEVSLDVANSQGDSPIPELNYQNFDGNASENYQNFEGRQTNNYQTVDVAAGQADEPTYNSF
jgi:hypothetical protein